MVFPASTTSLGIVVQEMQAIAQQLKAQAQNASTRMAAGDVDSDFVVQFLNQFYNAAMALSNWSATSGLDAAARASIPDYGAGNFTDDLNPVLDAAQAVVDWMIGFFPKDSDGFAQAYKLNPDGTRTLNTFTPTQTAPLRALITTFAATIA